MRRRALGIGLAVAGVTGAGAVLLLWGVTAGLPLPARPTAPPGGRPDLTLVGVRVVEDRAGERLWEAEADRATVFEREGRTLLSRGAEPVRITLYSDGRRLESVADRVVVLVDRRQVVLEGTVTARSDQGVVLRTDHLTWSADRRVLETDAPVTLERAGLTVEGEGMETDLTLERLTLRVHRGSRVTGRAEGRS